MPYYNGEKWACSSCTKGHRSSKCMHTDRILYKVRKPGRPLNSCPHTLPEKIKPGTFVNTSPTSMAGGNSSKEPCGCKGGQVEVAIPKMKHCSCTTAGDSSETPPQTPNPENGSGVKSGRVVKKSNRRKKSALSDEALGAVKEDVGMNDTAKSPLSGTAPTLTRTLPIYPGFPPHQGPSLLVHHNPATRQHLPTIPMHDAPPQWQPQSRVFMNGVPSTLGASAQNHLAVNNPMTPVAQHQTQNQFPMATPAGSSMIMNNVPWQSPDFFGGVPKTEASQMAEHDNSSVPVVMAAFNPTSHMNALTLNNDKIMVPLTHDEYIWIQHARTAGVDFSKLPKFIPEQRENTLEAHNLTPCSIPQPSSMHFPTNMVTAQPTPVTHPMPEPTKSKAGGCCKSKSVPSITTTATTEILSSPSSPRCKCGDACRCVPCADHPYNPAMLETIKGDMLLLQDPSNKKPSSSSSTSTTHQPDNETSNSPTMYDQDTYGDENSPANTGDAGIMADFNFVFQNYNYGSKCTEGRGGCMCGEGCTCVGCLTHGGHDGVIFNILGDTATNTAMGHVNENTNAASTPREEHQHQHQQHNQQNQQTDQNHRA